MLVDFIPAAWCCFVLQGPRMPRASTTSSSQQVGMANRAETCYCITALQLIFSVPLLAKVRGHHIIYQACLVPCSHHLSNRGHLHKFVQSAFRKPGRLLLLRNNCS